MSERTYRNGPESSASTTGITVAGFLMGAIVGAGLALLLAPGPGEETRRKLGETARRLRSKASDMAGQGRGGESDTESFPRQSGMPTGS